MSAMAMSFWVILMFARNDKDYAVVAAWSGLWVWVLWMGGFWS